MSNAWIVEVLIYGLMTFAIFCAAGMLNNGTRFERGRRVVVKICWGILILGMFYFVISVPYIGRFHAYTDTPIASGEPVSDEAKELGIHNRRIRELEDELTQTKDDLRDLSGQYKLILQLMMFGVIAIGTRRIFDSKNKNASDDGKFDLK